MKITRLAAWRVDLPFRDGSYSWSGGSIDGFDSTVVAVETDAGITGWGEMAPLGGFYAPSFAAGARAGVAELAPLLIGRDPTQISRLGDAMDSALKGHPYLKSAIDMACWDILGKRAGMPLAELLGGRFGADVALYRAVPRATTDAMVRMARGYADAGYRRIQVKVGGDPDADIEHLYAVADALGHDIVLFADANGGWQTHQARRFLDATRALDYYLEQPCARYAECLALRPHCARPMILDESIDGLAALIQAQADGMVDGVTIKIARVGGVTRARQLRDVAVALGIAVTVEDTGGSDIDTAAIAHLSLSTPEALRLHTVDFNNWVTVSNASGMPPCEDGRMAAPTGPGLGVEPRPDVLGEPFHVSS